MIVKHVTKYAVKEHPNDKNIQLINVIAYPIPALHISHTHTHTHAHAHTAIINRDVMHLTGRTFLQFLIYGKW